MYSNNILCATAAIDITKRANSRCNVVSFQPPGRRKFYFTPVSKCVSKNSFMHSYIIYLTMHPQPPPPVNILQPAYHSLFHYARHVSSRTTFYDEICKMSFFEKRRSTRMPTVNSYYIVLPKHIK